MTRRKHKDVEVLMDAGISTMARRATKRANAGQIDYKEMSLIIGCAMRWENLKRQLGVHKPEGV
jgi:hypothetical protein